MSEKYPYTDELHIKPFRNKPEMDEAIMNRRNFLKSLSAIVPASLMAKISMPEPTTSTIDVRDDFGHIDYRKLSLINEEEVLRHLESSGNAYRAGQKIAEGIADGFADGWYDMGRASAPGVSRGISPYWKPLVRMDASGYHVYSNGETFSIASEATIE